MSRRIKTLTILAIAALGALALFSPAASAAPAPAWQLSLSSHPTDFTPGALTPPSGTPPYPEYAVIAENVGAATTSGPITFTVQLPDGVGPAAAQAPSATDQTYENSGQKVGAQPICSAAGQVVTCTDTNPVDPGKWVKMTVPVDVDSLSDPTTLTAQATISGGGGNSATVLTSTTVSAAIAPLGFLSGGEGLNASVTSEDGTAATGAGSHPQQLNINFGLPTQRPIGGTVAPDGTLHDTKVDLPAGMVIDPSATPKCTAAQFQGFACPDASVVGVVDIRLATNDIGSSVFPIYNLQTPPGHAAAFGFDVVYVPVTILGGVRPADTPGSYRITSLTAAAPSPLAIFSARIQFWGSPTDASHDKVRGDCFNADTNATTCPVSHNDTPFLTLPTSCTDSMQIDGHIDLWEDVGNFYDRSANLTDSNTNSTPVIGCNALQFAPTLRARPTTNAADSPTGLDFDLGVPQNNNVNTLSTAHLRKAVVTLPEGLVLNPSSANGLGACASNQIGIDPDSGVPNDDAVQCPSASRIGTVDVDTPLLDHPLPGSVYVAKPFDNPFDSLLAIYAVVKDPQTNTLIKLAGHVVADPQTGQLATTFDDSPQLPFSDFKLSFFGGAFAPLRTPATCGTYSTTSSMTPWSAPSSGPPAAPKDTWSISQSPSGGSCASTPSSQPHAPSFDAGSASAIAGAFTPFVVHLRRDDGSQQFSSVTLTPPPGLLGKLAGVQACSESQIAQATSRSNEGDGATEQANPSCPAASEVGTLTAGAGAGPSPYYAKGHVYMAGPYKGAPLSFVIVTPAVAGPYDLGVVVTRVAIDLDPATAQITATSDPIPPIVHGIPLDVRSASISLDKPNFTLNGTSCDESKVTGSLLSTLGQSASLSQRFQLAECGNLGFKPKLALSLKGGTLRNGHPALTSVLTPRAGDANLAKVAVTLPPSMQLDQGHIQAPCTKSQFAVDQCPPQSVIGSVTATSPLVDYTLSGPIYLRTGGNPLPDLVLDLHGPASQPVRFVVVGKVDSVHTRLRTTFETVPDTPITKTVINLEGGRKGLLVNNTSLCKQVNRATVLLDGQNGKVADSTPKVAVKCPKPRKHHRHHKRHHGRH